MPNGAPAVVSAAMVLIAAALVGPSVGQDNQTLEKCSPISSGSGTAIANCTINNDVGPILKTIDSLISGTDARLDFLSKILKANADESTEKLGSILALQVEQLRRTVGLQFPIDFRIPRLTVAVRFPTASNELTAKYAERVTAEINKDSAWKDPNVQWPWIANFTDLPRLDTTNVLFPTSGDGGTLNFLKNLEVSLSCFSKDRVAGLGLDALTSRGSLQNLPSPSFAASYSLDPTRCGRGYAVGDPDRSFLIYAEGLEPKRGSGQMVASLTSAIDMLGGTCFAVIEDFSQDKGADDVLQSVFLLNLSLDLSDRIEFRTSMGGSVQNLIGVGGQGNWQMYRWWLPTQVSDFDQLATINEFPEAPSKC